MLKPCTLVLAAAFLFSWALTPSPAQADSKPVKVYILSGQSNMVGIGQVDGGGSRWGNEFIDPVLSVYAGDYDPAKDYDRHDPINTVALENFGGVKPDAFPGGGVQIVRGMIKMKQTGVYEMRPGFGDSQNNIMQIDGKEVYRKEAGGEAKHTHIKLEGGKAVPFKITYLAAGANGLGWYARMDIPGTLKTLVHEQGKFPYLIDEDGKWKPRDDVYYEGVVTATGSRWMTVGCGAGNNNIGPELGFGHIIGDYHDEPVLVLKSSQGNRSLAWDFLPPGSERYEHTDADGKAWVYAGYKDSPSRWEKGTDPEPINWYAGKQYDDCMAAAKDVLKNFDNKFPHWAGRGYEIAGFVWWQGHKDTGSELTAARYEQNLVHLINTMRKEFEAPNAPFTVATIGFDGHAMQGPTLTVCNAQLAVDGDSGKYPQFKGNVKSVDTRDFWRSPEVSPKNQGFHYNQNAETYMLVGEALGKAMVELQKQ